jgi:hypothetical protein
VSRFPPRDIACKRITYSRNLELSVAANPALTVSADKWRASQPSWRSLHVCHILERDATHIPRIVGIYRSSRHGRERPSLVCVIISVALNEYKLSAWAVMRIVSERPGRATIILAIVSRGKELDRAVAWGPGPRRPVAVHSYLKLSVCMVIY